MDVSLEGTVVPSRLTSMTVQGASLAKALAVQCVCIIIGHTAALDPLFQPRDDKNIPQKSEISMLISPEIACQGLTRPEQ